MMEQKTGNQIRIEIENGLLNNNIVWARKKSFSKTCIYCNQPFITFIKRKKFCSYNCCRSAYNLTKVKEIFKLTEEEKNKRNEIIKINKTRKIK
jgi:hypothetical protein